MNILHQEMTELVRSLMESALKTKEDLKFAVLTGCLRVGKESIFTGLNNLNVISIISDSYAECFGFTQAETVKLLSYYGREDKTDEVRKWYDGYRFGKTEVYNPWSVTSYLNSIIADGISYPRPYWVNTSSNGIIKELIENADDSAKAELEDMMYRKIITKPLCEEITYGDIRNSTDNLWNFLLFTGYLKMTDSYFDGRQVFVTMTIPNMEVRYIYERSILEWIKTETKKADFSGIYRSILEGNAQEVEVSIGNYLKRCISFYDEKETFYHGFMLEMLGKLKEYRILSNRETGDGRADILLKSLNEQNPAVVMELKYADSNGQLEAECDRALWQIEEKGYMEELEEDECTGIIKYGICFCKKNCRVK